MLGGFLEWTASRGSARFKSFREGKRAYEAVLAELNVSYARISPEQRATAANDSRSTLAERAYREAIQQSRDEGAASDVAVAIVQLGMLLHLVGRFEEAWASLQEARRIIEDFPQLRRPHQQALSSLRYHLGLLCFARDRPREARAHLEASLAIDRGIGDTSGSALVEEALALCPEQPEQPVSHGLRFDDTDKVSAHELLDADENEEDEEDEPASDRASTIEPVFIRRDDQVQHVGPFGSTAVEVLLVLDAVDSGETFLKALSEATPTYRLLRLMVADFGSDRIEPPTLDVGANLCGAVLVLDPSTLRNTTLQAWMEWCVFRVAAHADFRLFVHLRRLTEKELEAIERDSSEDQRLRNGIRDLRETVHMRLPASVAQLQQDLHDYLLHLESIRDRRRWRVVEAWGRRVVGALSGFVIGIAAVACVAIFVVLLAAGQAFLTSIAAMFTASAAVVGAIAGLPLFWAGTIIVAWTFRVREIAGDLSQDPRRAVWLVSAIAAAGASMVLVTTQPYASPVFAVAIVLGALMDAARRKRNTPSAGVLLRAYKLTSGHTERVREGRAGPAIPRGLTRTVGSVDPVSWPLFTPLTRIFISYARQSTWGHQRASELFARIRLAGGQCFLDRESLPPGSSWLRQLDDQLGDAVIFVLLGDKTAITRPMVAAEVIAALHHRLHRGFPHLIALVEPDLNPRGAPDAHEVFGELLSSPNESATRLITLHGEETTSHLASELVRRYEVPSVFPRVVDILVFGASVPLFALTTIMPAMGIPAFPVAIAVSLGKLDLTHWLTPATTWWLDMFLAYATAATMRQAVGARFEGFGGTRGRQVFSAMKFGAFGMAFLLSRLIQDLDTIGVLWAATMAWAGWTVTASLLRRLPTSILSASA